MGPYRTSLDVIQVANPCAERWGRMEGDDRLRFCKTCESHVYDLSSMTRAEVEALLAVTEGGLCVRFYRRADGRLATADCAPDRARARRRNARRGALAAVAFAITSAGAASVPMAYVALAPALEEVPPEPCSVDAEISGSSERGYDEDGYDEDGYDEDMPIYVMGAIQGDVPRPRAPGPTWVDPAALPRLPRR